MFILPGGVRDSLPVGFEKRMEETLREIESTMKDVYEVMFCNAVSRNGRLVSAISILSSWMIMA